MLVKKVQEPSVSCVDLYPGKLCILVSVTVKNLNFFTCNECELPGNHVCAHGYPYPVLRFVDE